MEVGSVVMIKSGGPKMTIASAPMKQTDINGKEFKLYVCFWFDVENKLNRSDFREDILKEFHILNIK